MNNRWKRIDKIKRRLIRNNFENDLICIYSSTQRAVYRYDKASDDYKCVAWADDFKPRSKGFRKGK